MLLAPMCAITCLLGHVVLDLSPWNDVVVVVSAKFRAFSIDDYFFCFPFILKQLIERGLVRKKRRIIFFHASMDMPRAPKHAITCLFGHAVRDMSSLACLQDFGR